jgi:integrase
MIDYAFKNKYISEKPIIKFLSVKNQKDRIVSELEERRILSYFYRNNKIMADFTIIGIHTGMRLSEILNLSVDDIDFKTNYIEILKNKTSIPRKIPMSKKVKNIHEKRIKNLEKESLKIFLGLSKDSVEYQWKKMRSVTGLYDINFHCLRHTFCSRIAEAGFGIFTIQKLAGHNHIFVTLRYIHISEENIEKAIDTTFN